MKSVKVLLAAVLLASASAIALTAFPACDSDSGGSPDTFVPTDAGIVEDSGGSPDTLVFHDVGIVADQNFRANPNGFNFVNYSDELPDGGGMPANLSAAEMSRMFGAGKVCTSGSGETCVLTPTADAWMTKENGIMKTGHCEGLAVLSNLIFSGQGNLKATDFGGKGEKNTYSIELLGNTNVQREIAYWFSTQHTSPASDYEIKYAPNEFLANLIFELQKPLNETWTIGLFDKNTGHAVTPSYVQNLGNGKVNVMVYDNNSTDTEQAIEFDTNANTFKYDDVTGDANNKNISLSPDKYRVQTQDWPPSASTTSKGAILGQITMDGPGDLMVSDDKGGRIGTVAGSIVKDMPGANVIVTRGGRPVFEVPEGIPLKVVIDGSSLKKTERTGVTFIVATRYVLAVHGIMLDPGRIDTVTFSADGSRLSYETASAQKPDLQIAYETADHAPDWDFVLHASNNSGSPWKVTMELDRYSSEIRAAYIGAAGDRLNAGLDAVKIDQRGRQGSSHPELGVIAGKTLTINYGNW